MPAVVGATFDHGPSLGHQHAGLALRQIEDVANLLVGQIDAVDLLRQLPLQPNVHADIYRATRVPVTLVTDELRCSPTGGWCLYPGDTRQGAGRYSRLKARLNAASDS